MSKIFNLFCLSALFIVAAPHCYAQGADNLTPVELRAIESRQYKSENLAAVSFAVNGAFTDLGYSGRIATPNNGEFSKFKEGKVDSPNFVKNECEVFIRQSLDKKYVIVRFHLVRFSRKDGRVENFVLTDPSDYNQIFSAISKALFIDGQQIPYANIR